MTFDPGNSSRAPFAMRRYWPYAFDCINDGIQWEESKSADVAAELRWLADQIAPVAKADEPKGEPSIGHCDEWGRSHYKIWVASAGTTKISLIKRIRETTHLGLKESKDIADGVVAYGCAEWDRGRYLADHWRADSDALVWLDKVD